MFPLMFPLIQYINFLLALPKQLIIPLHRIYQIIRNPNNGIHFQIMDFIRIELFSVFFELATEEKLDCFCLVGLF